MRIGIDVRLLEREMTGIGRFLIGFLDFVSKLGTENEYFLFSFGNLKNYRKKDFIIVPTGRNELIPPKIYSPIWLNFVLPRYIKKKQYRPFLFPGCLSSKS